MAIVSSKIFTAEVNEQFVLSKCDYFTDVHIWPLHSKLDPRPWLDNFTPDEKEYAVYLLNAVLYFPGEFIDQMFKSAFHALSRLVISPARAFSAVQKDWRDFVNRVLITSVTGEQPSITDSGLSFARKAKQFLGIPESRILANDLVLEELQKKPRPVVFVDDFVGSGNQFNETWEREYSLSNLTTASFKEIAKNQSDQFFYTPLICTEYGFARIRAKCPEVIVDPAHTISDKYNVFDDNSLIWPQHLQSGAKKFIQNASERAGIDVSVPSNWMGFHRLGLTVAFADAIPDATLPLFSWDKNGWNPLIRS